MTKKHRKIHYSGSCNMDQVAPVPQEALDLPGARIPIEASAPEDPALRVVLSGTRSSERPPSNQGPRSRGGDDGPLDKEHHPLPSYPGYYSSKKSGLCPERSRLPLANSSTSLASPE
jgi:hypothetical protein